MPTEQDLRTIWPDYDRELENYYRKHNDADSLEFTSDTQVPIRAIYFFKPFKFWEALNAPVDEKLGLFIRAKRDGKFCSYDISELSDDELQNALGHKSIEELIKWIAILAKLTRTIQQGQS